ncbi:hypothetical protein FAF44_16265 [Nonomuraea sp. MG754425]|uniref:hypothetical protein n=1 Tax=Nonomuraea sp. MG754425 TaxID=2570319 RepID=UPI001F26B3E6|nr:hypothetical protein [Nonomuraea sp. MG754425]MCF6469935.1 hypothetical protein [Nonomuraea sp. MG754425]
MTRSLLLVSLAAGSLTVPAPSASAATEPAIRSITVRPAEPVVGAQGSVRLVIDVIARGAHGKDGVTVKVEPGAPPVGVPEPRPAAPAPQGGAPAQEPAQQPAQQPDQQPAQEPVRPAEQGAAQEPAEEAVWGPGQAPALAPGRAPGHVLGLGSAVPVSAWAASPAGPPVPSPATGATPQSAAQPAALPAAQPAVQSAVQPAVQPVTPPVDSDPPVTPGDPDGQEPPKEGPDLTDLEPARDPAQETGTGGPKDGVRTQQDAAVPPRLVWRLAHGGPRMTAPKQGAAAMTGLELGAARVKDTGGWQTWRFLPDKRLTRFYPAGTWTITATAKGANGATVTEYASFELRRETRLAGVRAERPARADGVRLRGSLTRVDPRGLTDYGPFAKQGLEILWRPDTTSEWQTVGRTTTDAAGAFVGMVLGHTDGYWRVRYPGTRHYAADISKTRQID